MLRDMPYRVYDAPAAAKSVAGNLTPKEQRRISAPTSTALFLCPSVMAAVRGQASAWLVSFVAGCEIPRTVAPIENLTSKGDSENKGASPMTKLRLSISRRRADYHRAMAKHALYADSSLSVRLKRFNDHMDKARALEAGEVRP